MEWYLEDIKNRKMRDKLSFNLQDMKIRWNKVFNQENNYHFRKKIRTVRKIRQSSMKFKNKPFSVWSILLYSNSNKCMQFFLFFFSLLSAHYLYPWIVGGHDNCWPIVIQHPVLSVKRTVNFYLMHVSRFFNNSEINNE